jgi:hypothetical protein
MGLTLPTVGVDAGPLYATLLDNALQSVDSHSHVAGQGVQITPSAININSALVMNNQALTLASQLNMQSTVVNVSGTLSVVGNDLQYVNGAGVTIPLTIGSSIAGAPGNISGITGTAGVTYYPVAKLFKFESSTSTAAYIDCASILLRNISPNSTYSYALNPPSSLTSNYNITLPAIPSSTKVLTMDVSGNMGSALITDSLISTQSITNTSLGTGSVDNRVLAGSSVTVDKTSFPSSSFSGAILIDNTTNGSKIIDNTIINAKLATNIDGSKISPNTIPGDRISTGSPINGGTQVAPNTINNSILSNSLKTTTTVNGTISSPHYVIATLTLFNLSYKFANQRPVMISIVTGDSAGNWTLPTFGAGEGFWVREVSTNTYITRYQKQSSVTAIDYLTLVNNPQYEIGIDIGSGSGSYSKVNISIIQL